MRKMSILLAAATAVIATPASAQALWGDFQYGMSAAAVRAADARVAVNPQAAQERLRDGSACELVIATVEIDKQPFRSCFYFRDDKLVQVSLGSATANPEQYRGIVLSLRARHGPDFAETQSGRIQEARWTRADNSSVWLMYIGIGQPTMRIVYEQATAKPRYRVTQPRTVALSSLSPSR